MRMHENENIPRYYTILFFIHIKSYHYKYQSAIIFTLSHILFGLENVNEYLKLAANADKQQLTRIKTVFEKKNQKSAHSIAQLQKKLDSYTKKLKNYEMNGAPTSHRQPREMLRDMGQGLK